MSANKEHTQEQMRLDKWLWCARFFRTRSLAASAMKAGKVRIFGQAVKPARLIKVGDELEISIKPFTYRIAVNRLAKSRVSAKDAELMYVESIDSVKQREQLVSQLKSIAATQSPARGKPDKRTRRKIIRFTRKPD